MSAPSIGPKTAQELLADSSWRSRQSLWLIVPVVGVCGFGWVGWIIAAVRTGRRRYTVFAVVYGALTIVGFAGTGEANDAPGWDDVDWYFTLMIVSAIATALHAVLENNRMMQALAERQGVTRSRTPAGQVIEPQGFLALEEQRGAYWGEGPSTGTERPPASFGPAAPIDANQATAEELSQLRGMTAELAHRFVKVRGARGGFFEGDDVMTLTGMPPHVWVRVRDQIVLPPRVVQRPLYEPPTQGRILDL